jgi:PBSX family phage portal protein
MTVKKTKRTAVAIEENSQNKQVLKAIVFSPSEEAIKKQSNDMSDSEDFFQSALGTSRFIEPPLNPLILSMLPESSSELVQCIEAMEINIEAFGQRLIEIKMTDAEKNSNKAEMDREYEEINALLEITNSEEDMTAVRRLTRKDIETTGNGYWELLPNIADPTKLEGINHLPSYKMRLVRQDNTPTKVEKKYLSKDFKWKSKFFYKRFRRYVQQQGTKVVFFKEWDDPRTIDKRNGDVIEKPDSSNKKYWATGVKHFKIPWPRSPYGMPRIMGNLYSIFGSRAADQINYFTFKNNNVPSMVITVSNGMLTEGSINRIEEYISSQIKRSDNYSKFLLLEAETQDEGNPNPGQMKIDIKPLQDTQRDDQLFQNYDKNNADKIRRSFRLPPIYVGKAEDFNKATAESSRRLADEQVFDPERKAMDKAINAILTHYNYRFWKVKSNSPNVTDDEVLAKILGGVEKTGGITPRLSREILSDILGRELPEIDTKKFDPDVPFSLTMADAVKKKDGLAPNQGQVHTEAPGTKQETPEEEESPEGLLKSINKLLDLFEEDDETFQQEVDIGIFGKDE